MSASTSVWACLAGIRKIPCLDLEDDTFTFLQYLTMANLPPRAHIRVEDDGDVSYPFMDSGWWTTGQEGPVCNPQPNCNGTSERGTQLTGNSTHNFISNDLEGLYWSRLLETPSFHQMTDEDTDALVPPAAMIVEPHHVSDEAKETIKLEEASLVHTIVGDFIQKHAMASIRPGRVGKRVPMTSKHRGASFCRLLGLPTIGRRLFNRCLPGLVRRCDVLMGQGSRSNQWPGNQMYNLKRNDLTPAYKAASSTLEKRHIALQLMKFVEDEQKGRFVQLNQDTNKWEEVTDFRTKYKKCTLALRTVNTTETRRMRRARYPTIRQRISNGLAI